MKDFNKTPADCWQKLSMFKIWQKPEELIPFLELIRERSQAKGFFRALEIGAYAGGTTVLFAQYCDEVVSIDLNDPLVGCDNVQYIIGDSGDIKTLHAAQLAGGAKQISHGRTVMTRSSGYDLLFIDGDHSTEGCLRDYELYSGLVNPGGMIVFHDIISSDHHRSVGCNVDIAWDVLNAEAKLKGWKTLEIKEGEDYWGGIGIIFKP